MELCISNANLWLNEFDELYKKGSYGHSYALLFYGAESLVHAYYCWLIVNDIKKPKDKDVVEIFSFHETKMKVLFGFR